MFLLKRDKLMGQGAYAKIYTLKTPDEKKTKFIAKSYQFNEETRDLSRYYSSFYNEYVALSRLNRLRGIQHEKNQVLFIYEKQRGENAKNSAVKNKNWLCFKALRELHRKQIAHMDPHSENFIIHKNQQHATVIDFGLSQEAGWLNCTLDGYYFFRSRNLTNPTMFNFFAAELTQYYSKHKLSLILSLLGGGFIFVASSYGIPFLGIAPTLFEALSNTMFMGTIIEELLSKGAEHLFAFTLSQLSFSVESTRKSVVVFHYMKSAFALFYLSQSTFTNGAHMISACLCLGNLRALTNFTAIAHSTLSIAMHGLCFYFPLQQIFHTTRKFLTDTSMPACVLKKQNQMLIKFPSHCKVIDFKNTSKNNNITPPEVQVKTRVKKNN